MPDARAKSPNHYHRTHVYIFKVIISPHIHTLTILCDQGYSLTMPLWHQDITFARHASLEEALE
ncbi:hypothetical protein PO909_012580 [Leuciscus waleckii]